MALFWWRATGPELSASTLRWIDGAEWGTMAVLIGALTAAFGPRPIVAVGALGLVAALSCGMELQLRRHAVRHGEALLPRPAARQACRIAIRTPPAVIIRALLAGCTFAQLASGAPLWRMPAYGWRYLVITAATFTLIEAVHRITTGR